MLRGNNEPGCLLRLNVSLKLEEAVRLCSAKYRLLNAAAEIIIAPVFRNSIPLIRLNSKRIFDDVG